MGYFNLIESEVTPDWCTWQKGGNCYSRSSFHKLPNVEVGYGCCC